MYVELLLQYACTLPFFLKFKLRALKQHETQEVEWDSRCVRTLALTPSESYCHHEVKRLLRKGYLHTATVTENNQTWTRRT